MNSLAAYALRYAELGIPVLPLYWLLPNGQCSCRDNQGPCKGRGKHPLNHNGLTGATTDKGIITKWWRDNPNANIGLACGFKFDVIDVDPRNGGVESIKGDQDVLDKLLTQHTGQGGQHYLVAPGSALIKRTGIDMINKGHYIVAEPSLTIQHYYFDDWDVLTDPLPVLLPAPEAFLTPPVPPVPPIPLGGDKGGRVDTLTASDQRLLRSAVNCFDSFDYELWIKIGQCLVNLGAFGRSVFFDWSQQFTGHYDPAQCAAKWASFTGDRAGYKGIFKLAYAHGWDGNKKAAPEPPGGIAWLNGDDLAENASAPVFLINNIIESGTQGLIAGSSQSFKSFCVLKMAHSICTGQDFFNHDVFTTGKVLYICGEGLGALGRRIKALKIVKGNFNNNFFVLNRPLFIDNIAEMVWLKEAIDKIVPVFVVFDTFSSLATSTKENINEEVARVLRMVADCCIDSGAASIVVHHYGKDTEKGTRGASAFSANVDYEISMRRVTDTLDAIMSCKKSKDGDYFPDLEITAHIVDIGLMRQDGCKATSLVLKHSGGADYLTPRQKIAWGVIGGAIDVDGHTINGRQGITERQVKDCFNLAFEHEGANKYRIFGKVMPALKKKGVIDEKNGYFFLKPAYSPTYSPI